ncbi:MAG: cobaltochelatase subunit CobS, partial [Rhodospirillales bacterium]|nr:cobaltochelatase subunit CobS [Rhodospirillales bacterium]
MTATDTIDTKNTSFPLDAPDITISVRQTFGIDSDMEAPAFSEGDEHVPDL